MRASEHALAFHPLSQPAAFALDRHPLHVRLNDQRADLSASKVGGPLHLTMNNDILEIIGK